MRMLTNVMLVTLLFVCAENLQAGGQEQGGEKAQQNPAPEQQRPQTSSSAAVQSVTGCLVRSDNGYSLKTDTDTLPIESDKDLSQYIDKKIKVTGILEHHTASNTSAAHGPVVITDLRLRLVASVIGTCNQSSK